jgi:hypothetical protein
MKLQKLSQASLSKKGELNRRLNNIRMEDWTARRSKKLLYFERVDTKDENLNDMKKIYRMS